MVVQNFKSVITLLTEILTGAYLVGLGIKDVILKNQVSFKLLTYCSSVGTEIKINISRYFIAMQRTLTRSIS